MVGAIARTDLFGPHLAVHLALEALRTLQVRLRGLPDDIAVFPTHGGGSFCGTGGRSGHETTLGQERTTNPFFLTTEVMPFLARALNQHRYPTYYRDMAAINQGGAPLLGRDPAAHHEAERRRGRAADGRRRSRRRRPPRTRLRPRPHPRQLQRRDRRPVQLRGWAG